MDVIKIKVRYIITHEIRSTFTNENNQVSKA